MRRPSHLSPATPQERVAYAKSLLWEGRPVSEVATLTTLSEGLVSRIKSGKAHHSVPWPDGSLGPMPERTGVLAPAPEEESWSGDTLRFLELPTDFQDRILTVVNERRGELGLPLIPNTSEAYQRLLSAPPEEQIWEVDALRAARVEEDRRMATAMREFDGILSENVTLRSDEAIDAILAATRDAPAPAEPAHVEPIAPQDYDKLPLNALRVAFEDCPALRAAYAAGDALLLEAFSVVLWQLRAAPSMWTRPEVVREATALRARFATFPSLREAIEGEWKDLLAHSARKEDEEQPSANKLAAGPHRDRSGDPTAGDHPHPCVDTSKGG